MPFSTTRSYATNQRVQIGPAANSVATSEIVIANESRTIASVRVALDVQHNWPGDLRVEIINPNGRSVTLVDKVPTRSPSLWAFNNTRFKDGATPLASGSVPYVGEFDPLGSLSTFAGGHANGVWTLKITDQADQDKGELLQWSLSITFESAVLEIDWGYYRSVKSRLQHAAAAVRAHRYLRCLEENGGIRDPAVHLKCMLPGGPRVVLPPPGDPIDPPFDQPTFEEQLMQRLPEGARPVFAEALMAGINEMFEQTLDALDQERALARSDLEADRP